MYERLLVPVNGGALCERAFAASIELAHKLGASIVGFIAEPYAGPPPLNQALGQAISTPDSAALAHSQAVLSQFDARARDAGVPFQGVATQATQVSDAILQAAEQHGCDTIVMVTQGRSDLSALLSGSTTRRVMAHTTLPVLLLH
jgi:nucleotide-binding universal stress UspA family protein